MQAIDRGFAVSAAVSAVTAVALAGWYMQDCRPAVAVVLGLVLAAVTQCLTQYFTDARHRPVREVAESTRTGHILSAFSLGLEPTVWAILAAAGATTPPGCRDPRPAAGRAQPGPFAPIHSSMCSHHR